MTRNVLIIRHAKATGGRHDRHLYPPEGAPLSEEGLAAAGTLKQKLRDRGVDFDKEPVAISQLIRTRQTAEAAGLRNLKEYELLNEIESGLEPDVLDKMVDDKQVPQAALEAAGKLLQNPPPENIWVTHGMLIAGVAETLGIPKDTLYIPEMASIVEIEVPN